MEENGAGLETGTFRVGQNVRISKEAMRFAKAAEH